MLGSGLGQLQMFSAALYPHELEFRSASGVRKYPENGTPCSYEIAHPCGKLAIEAKEGTLQLGIAPTEVLTPNLIVTVSYHRAENSLYYPEFLIPVQGYVHVSPKT